MVKRLSNTNQNSNSITNVPTPVSSGDAVNKAYVDANISDEVVFATSAPVDTDVLWIDTDDDSGGSTGDMQKAVYDPANGARQVAFDDQLGKAITPIAVSVTTAAATAAKVGTTTGGSYTPVSGDIINVTFTNSNTATSPTLNIDGSGAKNVLLGNINPTAVALAGTKVLMWYDGAAYQLFGSQQTTDTNTTYTTATLSAVENTAASLTLAIDRFTIASYASGQDNLTLPATAAIGSIIEVYGKTASGFKITAAAGDNILWEGQDSGAAGYIAGAQYSVIGLRCITANTTWEVAYYEGDVTLNSGYKGSLKAYVDGKSSSSWVFNETPSGTVNGTNTVFTLSAAPAGLVLSKNGVVMKPGSGNDYTLSGSTITFTTAPATGTVLLATFGTTNSTFINGSNSLVTDEAPTGTINSTNTSFTTAAPYIGGSLKVFVNGLKQQTSTHFTETTPASGIFTISDAPLAGDIVTVEYQKVASVAGNADTVDGIHANATATANQLLPLDSSARAPIVSLPTEVLGYVEVTTNQSGVTTEVDLTGLSLTINMPVTDKKLLLEAYLPTNVSTVIGDRSLVKIKEGSTIIQQDYSVPPTLGTPIRISRIITPTPGTHTYKLTGMRESGSGSMVYYGDTAPTVKTFMAKLV